MDRFWKKVSPEPNSGCWLWTASVDHRGYGQFKLGSTMVKAHRLAYELERGTIQAGLHVCHSCDVRSCVNPDHLWLGTNTDNHLDKLAKGRQARGPALASAGTANPNNKFSKELIENTRELHRLGVSKGAIARSTGISRTHVGRILNGIQWKVAS